MNRAYSVPVLLDLLRYLANGQPDVAHWVGQAVLEIEAGQALARAAREFLAAEEAVSMAGISEAGKAIDRSKAAEARLREALHAVDGKGSET